jgi:hypothetical protein
MLVTNRWQLFAAKAWRHPTAGLHILVKDTRRRDDVDYFILLPLYLLAFICLDFINYALPPLFGNLRLDADERERVFCAISEGPGCSAPNVRVLWDVCESGICRELSPPNLRTPPSLATRFAS